MRNIILWSLGRAASSTSCCSTYTPSPMMGRQRHAVSRWPPVGNIVPAISFLPGSFLPFLCSCIFSTLCVHLRYTYVCSACSLAPVQMCCAQTLVGGLAPFFILRSDYLWLPKRPVCQPTTDLCGSIA